MYRLTLETLLENSTPRSVISVSKTSVRNHSFILHFSKFAIKLEYFNLKIEIILILGIRHKFLQKVL